MSSDADYVDVLQKARDQWQERREFAREQFEAFQRTIDGLKHGEALENIYARPDDRRRDDDRCECDREHEAVRIAQGLLDAMGKARHEFDALRGCGREER